MVKYTASGYDLKKRSSSLAAWLQEQRSWQAPAVLAEASSADPGGAPPTEPSSTTDLLVVQGSSFSCFTPCYPASAPAELLELIVHTVWSQETK